MALTTIKTGGLADNSVTDAKVADAITVTGAQTGITQVGTLTAGTWNAGVIASAYLDADTAHLSGSTFTGDVYISASGSPSFRVTDTTNTVTGKFQADNTVGKVGTHTDHAFQLFSDNTTALTVDTSQNIGIGVTNPSSFDDEAERLVVGTGSGNQGITIYAGTSSRAKIHFADGASGTSAYRGMVSYDHNGDSMSFATANTTRLTIASDGKVGINCTPAEKFTVNGDTRLDGKIGIGKSPQSGYEFDLEASSGNANMRLKATGTNQGVRLDLDHHSGDKAEVHFYNGGYSSTAIVSNEIANGLLFKVGGTSGAGKKDAFSINSVGNVGVGTSSPTAFYPCFQVEGTQPAVILNDNATDGFISMIADNTDGAIMFDHSGVLLFRHATNNGGSSASTVFELSSSEAIFNAETRPQGNNERNLGLSGYRWATVWGVVSNFSSDQTLKKNIATSDLGADFINSLNPIKFNWKKSFGDDTKQHYGFLAQEIKETGLSDSVTGEEGEMGMNYNDLIAPMVKAIQELSAELEKLKNG